MTNQGYDQVRDRAAMPQLWRDASRGSRVPEFAPLPTTSGGFPVRNRRERK